MSKMSNEKSVIIPWVEFEEYIAPISQMTYKVQQDYKRSAHIRHDDYEGNCIQIIYRVGVWNIDDREDYRLKDGCDIFSWGIKKLCYTALYTVNSDFGRWVDKLEERVQKQIDDDEDLPPNKYDRDIENLGLFEASRKWLIESVEKRQELQKAGDEAFIDALKRLVVHKDKQIKEMTQQKDMFAKENATLKKALSLMESEESLEVSSLSNYMERLQDQNSVLRKEVDKLKAQLKKS